MNKELNIIVGGNGSGKSTFYYRYLAKLNLPFLNADEFAKQQWPDAPESHSYDAAKLVEQKRILSIATGLSFCFETVFSHPSKVDFIAKAKSQGYRINLFVIHIDASPDTNIARVANRITQGGHSVPEDKIRERIPRMLRHVHLAVPLCETVSFYDNTSANHGFKRVAVLQANKVLACTGNIPKWVADCVEHKYTQQVPF